MIVKKSNTNWSLKNKWGGISMSEKIELKGKEEEVKEIAAMLVNLPDGLRMLTKGFLLGVQVKEKAAETQLLKDPA